MCKYKPIGLLTWCDVFWLALWIFGLSMALTLTCCGGGSRTLCDERTGRCYRVYGEAP